MRFEGSPNVEKGFWELKQIYIDEKPILDEFGKPLNVDKKFRCAIDYFIAEGGQGFSMIKNAEKSNVTVGGSVVKIDEVLMDKLKEAPVKYAPGSEYPCFNIAEV